MITIDKSEIIQSRNELPSEVETLDEAREALQKGEKGKAIKIYKRAIKNGSVYAPNLLAELYFNENGRFSKKKILDLMILGASRGDVVAQKNCGIRLQDIEYTKKIDYHRAFKYLYSSAVQGNSEAAIALAYLYVSFKIEKDEYEAAYWAEKALVDIHDEAINLINHLTMSSEEISEKADAYFYGADGVKPDYKRAAALFHVATLMNNPSVYAHAMLGYCYMHAKGVKADFVKAKEYFEYALEKGNKSVEKYVKRLDDQLRPYVWNDKIDLILDTPNTDEQQKLLDSGNILYSQKKYLEALELYIKAAAIKCNDAYTKMGYMYLNGQGPKPSRHKAFHMFKEAADLGDAIAQYEVSKLYLTGTGCAQSNKLAFYYMYQSASQGNPLATRELCKYYRDGIGCVPDHLEAFYWLNKTFNAKDKESVDLYESLTNVDGKEASIRGNMFYTGNIVTKDLPRAFAYFYAGAESSTYPSAVCMYNCGLCFFYGRGVEKNYQAAIDYATAAKNNGYTHADALIAKAQLELERSTIF